MKHATIAHNKYKIVLFAIKKILLLKFFPIFLTLTTFLIKKSIAILAFPLTSLVLIQKNAYLPQLAL